MNKILSPDFKKTQVDIVLLILRVGVAVLMLTHGIPKLQMLFGEGPVQFPGIMGLTPTLSLALAVFAEVVCSILIFIGLGTRLASVPLIITMLVAVFMIHLNDPFVAQEPGLLFIFLYIPILFLGGGRYSLDFLIGSLQNKAFVKR
tara:strand:+ start:193 stop:630 length:438 start_codon:yes stop_codon:yes gene_type:complete